MFTHSISLFVGCSIEFYNDLWPAATEDSHRTHDVRGTQRQFSENICSEDDLRSRILGTFFPKFLACLPLLGFSNI